MGDDPYDFEIALPAAPTNAGRSTRDRSSDSDEDVSDAGGSLSNMSGISSDEDSGRGSGHEREQRTESSLKRVTKSTIEPKTASSSALDRAKNFLSKYSSATSGESNGSNGPASSRSRRISLDSDDDDNFSMESSSGGEKEDIDSKKSYTTITTNTRDNDPPQSSKQQIIATQTNERQEAPNLQSDEDDGSRSSDHLPPYSSSNVVVIPLPVVAIQLDDRSSDESHAGDSIESFHSGGSDERIGKSTMETPRSTLPKSDFQDQHEESAGDYDESFQSLSQEIETKQAYAFRPQQSIASESEVYYEDAFEEDSTAMTSAPAHNSSTVTTQPTVITEKNFDYSMDFSDDENKGQTQLETSELEINGSVREDKSPAISSRGDSGKDNGEQCTVLESNSSREGEHDEHELDHGVVEPLASRVVEPRASADNKSPAVAQSEPLSDLIFEDNELRHEPTSAARDSSSSSIDNMKDRLSSDAGTAPPTPAAPFQRILLQQNKRTGEETPAAEKQQHVEIVRAYKLDEDIRVEMKDASTQFTGNHTAIQTDLVPDGMHNLFVSSTPTPTGSFGRENEVPPSEAKSAPCHSKQELPPPPPISPLLGTYMYSLDALKLPLSTSTSLYKQQLLSLQEQILQKKRETERIVHDRMAFQYSSLRGTERFIADRRVQKLELWEALMRVDPTLNERKAREAARLAQAATM